MSQPAAPPPSTPASSGSSSGSERSRSEIIAWRNAIFVIFALSGLSVATWAARLPAIRDGLDLTTGVVGLLILCGAAGSIVGLIMSAWMLARLGPRRGMVLVLIVVATGLVFVGLGASIFSTPVLVAIGLVLFGFGNGACDVMMNVEGAAAEKELGKTVMPLMHACFSFGTVAGAGLGTLTAWLDISVFWHTLAMATLIAAGAVVAVRFVPIREELGDETAEHPHRADWKQRLRENLSVWADMRLILIGVVILGMAFAEGSANDWIALAVVDGHHQNDAVGAIIFGVFVSAMTLARVLGGPFIDRFGRVTMLRVSSVSAVVGLLLFIVSPWLWLVIVGAALWGAGAALGFPVGMSAAADGDPKRAAARVSAVAIIGYCAFLVGPPLIGLLGQQFGLLNALFVVLALIALAGLASPAARED